MGPNNQVVESVPVHISGRTDWPAGSIIDIDTFQTKPVGAIKRGKIQTGREPTGLPENDVAFACVRMAVGIAKKSSDFLEIWR